MDRMTAERVLDRIKAWEAIFGDLHGISWEIDEQEGRALRQVIGALVIDIHLGIVRPIVVQYPDLDPDKEDEEQPD